MLISDIKPIGKVGKNLLKSKSANEIIELIIEKPIQKACKVCKNKNIETIMSSANKNNIMKCKEKIVNKKDIVGLNRQEKYPTFVQAGKGYAWLMINYESLSDENRELLFLLEENLGEESIWFVKSCYVETMNKFRKILKLKPLTECFQDLYAEKFSEKQVLLIYNNKYPKRCVFIRMPINENTTVRKVENYFYKITSKLKEQ